MGDEDRRFVELDPDDRDLFLQDVNEHLQTMESGILRLERAGDAETLNAVFRAAHTLKATAGVVGHRSMAELTHTMETLFDRMRAGTLSPSARLADELLTAVDILRALRDEVVGGSAANMDVVGCMTRLRQMAEGPTQPVQAVRAHDDRLAGLFGKLTPGQAAQAARYAQAGQAIFEIVVVVAAESFAPGARLLQAALGASKKGRVVAQLPSEADLLEDRHAGHLWLVLAAKVGQVEIEAALNNVFELTQVCVRPYAPGVAAPAPVAPAPPASGSAPSVAPASVTPPAPAPASAPSVAPAPVTPPAPAPVPAPPPAPAPASSTSTNSSKSPEVVELDKTVRINVEHLDTLMDLVGELVTDRVRLEQLERTLWAEYGKGAALSALDETVAHMGQIIDQVQDEVMHSRLLPISHLFDKLPRMVRDMAHRAGKRVDLTIKGESTELDRSIIEVIGDPLIHLVRNAVDHGLETPLVRAAGRKTRTGHIYLTARHAEGQIIVTVRDDGRGINPSQTRQVAVRRGLLSVEDAAGLSDDDAMALIFRPGFSTAEKISDVSGRGVGLDVVHTNVSRIGGSVMVESEVGRGATFRLTLPLTLAILQTMLVGLWDDVYAIPMTSIVESLYLSDTKVNSLKGRPAIQWRNQVLPLVDLRQFFSRPEAHDANPEPHGAKPAIIAVNWGKLQAGLVVDRIIAKQDIVVKPFAPAIGPVPGLSGCTILGNGRVALIVDVPGLINSAVQAHRQAAFQEAGFRKS